MISKNIQIKQKPNSLIDRILDACETKDIKQILQDYWNTTWKNNEDLHLTGEIKEAFLQLKTFTKYKAGKGTNVFPTMLKLDNNNTIAEEHQINQKITEFLSASQQSKEDNSTTHPHSFPYLPPIKLNEIIRILKSISRNKASNYDMVSDTLINKMNIHATAKLMTNLWSQPPELLDSWPEIFKSRLIPLNKIAPEIATVDKIRPIVINSLMIRILEGRFQEKLKQYMTNQLHISQTGFVAGGGIFVNVERAVRRIKLRTESRRNVFGVFVDFSSAFNTIYHEILLRHLNSILEPSECIFIKAILSRLQVTLGNSSFHPNRGVPQGSSISPALFNIYSEGLLYELEKIGISAEDICAYADDILIITPSRPEITRIIDTINEWSKSQGLLPNPSKSGIVEFLPRRGNNKQSLKIGTQICHYPVLKKYKYLGCILNQKLTLED